MGVRPLSHDFPFFAVARSRMRRAAFRPGFLPAHALAIADLCLFVNDRRGFLKLVHELDEFFLKNHDLMSRKLCIAFPLTAFDNIEKEIADSIFLYVKKEGSFAGADLCGIQFSANTHL